MCVDDSLTLLLAAGAVLRLTRLAATDTITEPLRKRLPAWIHAMVTCGWCVSIWIAVPVAATWWAWGHNAWWHVVCLALTASWLAGSLHNTGRPSQHEVEVIPVGALNVVNIPVDGGGK